MFKDSFNCLNDVHKRCILNSNEFCTHLEILKKNFQGCLSVQLSKFIAFKLSIYLCLRSFCVAVVSRRLDYNITTHHICQQLFSIFFKKVVIYFKHTIYRGFHYIYIQVIYAFLLYYISLLCLILSFLLPYMDYLLQYCCLVYLLQLRFRHLLQHYYL